jgi:hypothetical protein
MPGMTLGQPGRRKGEKREQYPLGLGESEGALEGRPDGVRFVECIAGDRPQHEGHRHPDVIGPWNRVVEH